MVVLSVCMDCKHLIERSDKNVPLCCKAYPNGIPNDILFDGSGEMCTVENADTIHFSSIYDITK